MFAVAAYLDQPIQATEPPGTCGWPLSAPRSSVIKHCLHTVLLSATYIFHSSCHYHQLRSLSFRGVVWAEFSFVPEGFQESWSVCIRCKLFWY